MLRQRRRLERLNLRPVHAHQQHTRHKRPKNLAEDIMWDLLPGETLPDGETEGDGWIEVPAGSGGAGDDGEGDTYSEGPTDLEEGAEGGGAKGAGGVYGEGGYGGDTWKAVAEGYYVAGGLYVWWTIYT